MASYGVSVPQETSVETDRVVPNLVINPQPEVGAESSDSPVAGLRVGNPSSGVMEYYMANMLNNNSLPLGLLNQSGDVNSVGVTGLLGESAHDVSSDRVTGLLGESGDINSERVTGLLGDIGDVNSGRLTGLLGDSGDANSRRSTGLLGDIGDVNRGRITGLLGESGDVNGRRGTEPPGESGEVNSGRITPPPSYDETIKLAVPLAFIDFWPRCLQFSDDDFFCSPFESFDQVVQEANVWLSAQSRIVLRNCETVEIKVTSLDEYIDMYTVTKTRTPKVQYRIPVYVKGLRIWYSSKILNKLPCGFGRTPCKLSYVNIRPSCSDVPNGYRYENFPSLMEKCNNLINCGVISGRILNAETVRVKESSSDDSSILTMSANPDQCVWRDSYYKVALTFLRVFFLPDSPVREELHYRDFLPQCLRRSNSHPKFVDFQEIVNDCQLWILQLGADFRLLNAQTVEGKCCSEVATFMDSSATFHADYEATPRVRFLRIYYAKPDGALSHNYLAPLVSYRTFVPNLSGRRRHHETLAMLMRRVESWLRATGASAVCAETLVVPDYHAKSHLQADGCVFRSEYVEGGSEFDQETLVYVIRIYLDSVYPEPTCDPFDDGEDCIVL